MMEARVLIGDHTVDGVARSAAADALAAMPDPAALPALLRVLDDADEDKAVRLAVVGALEALGDPAAVPALLAVLARDEGEYHLDERIGNALPTFGPAAVPILLAALESVPDVTKRTFFTLTALGLLGDPRAVAPLQAILADPEWADNHATALDALHALGAAPPVATLATLARDRTREQFLRISAIGALIFPCVPDATTVLLTLLDDPDRMVARQAIHGLGACGDAAAVEPLLDRFLDPEGTTRLAIAFALGRLGDAHALPALRTAAEHDTFVFMGKTMGDEARRAIGMIMRDRPQGQPPG